MYRSLTSRQPGEFHGLWSALVFQLLAGRKGKHCWACPQQIRTAMEGIKAHRTILIAHCKPSWNISIAPLKRGGIHRNVDRPLKIRDMYIYIYIYINITICSALPRTKETAYSLLLSAALWESPLTTQDQSGVRTNTYTTLVSRGFAVQASILAQLCLAGTSCSSRPLPARC